MDILRRLGPELRAGVGLPDRGIGFHIIQQVASKKDAAVHSLTNDFKYTRLCLFKSQYFKHDNCEIGQSEEENEQDEDYFCEEVSVGDGAHELTDEIQFDFHYIDLLNEVLSVLDLLLQY